MGLIPSLAIKGYVLFGFLWIGVVCVAARDLFLWMCPTLLQMSGYCTAVFNNLFLFLNLFINACVIVVDAIIIIVEAISVLGGKKVHGKMVHWDTKLIHINEHQFREVISSTAATCTKYDNMPIIVQFLVRHKYV